MGRETEMKNFYVVEENREDRNDLIKLLSILVPLLQLTANSLVLLSHFSCLVSGTGKYFSKIFKIFHGEHRIFSSIFKHIRPFTCICMSSKCGYFFPYF